jgi:methanogenic corrinoid protein MtbC1
VRSSEEHAAPEAEGPWLTIGALSRATAISVDTLRTWERRYGYPRPERKPSGHRLYPASAIPRLRRIAEVLARGHRPAEVVTAPEAMLAALLDASPAAAARRPADAGPGPAHDEVLDAVARFDAETMTRVLLAEWAMRGPLPFVEQRVAPLVRAVGDAWEAGRLDIRHEHFFSERLEDVLRSVRMPWEERARGPLVVLATLPGESHGLGLQMAAVVLATAGCRLLYLGTEVPAPELVAVARDLGARAVGVSVSSATGGSAATRQIARLRALLPRRVALLVGGAGTIGARAGVTRIADLAALHAWARRETQPA